MIGRTPESLRDPSQADPAAAASTSEAAVRTTGRWFGPAGRPLLGWLSCAPDRMSVSGVVVLPPVAYAYWCSHRTLRVLAETLVERGHTVLRVDYDGTGDSAGDQWDPDRVRLWRDSARAAAGELRSLGCERIVVVGAKLGGTFALLDGQSLGADRIVVWAPVLSGRRYVRELRLLSKPVPEAEDPLDPPGTIVAQGSVLSAQTLADLGRLAITKLTAPPAPEILVVGDRASGGDDGVEHLRSLGADVRHVQLEDGELALATPPEEGDADRAVIAEISDFIGIAEPGSVPLPADRPEAELSWGKATIREQVLRLGEHGYVGLLSSPLEPDPTRATVLFLNTGSESHVGPGRAWVEFARSLAAEGYRTVRVDFRGWGESPDDGRAPGRLYDPRGEGDTVEIVGALEDAGHERVVLVGLCASAWIALRAVLQRSVAGVIALNPQMYWEQGDTLTIDWDKVRAGRAQEIRRLERGQRCGLWNLLDAVGYRPWAGAWLDDLKATAVPIHLVFAEGDDGLVFLRQRHPRRLARVKRAGTITVRELHGVDHPMHLAWRRPRVLAALVDILAGDRGRADLKTTGVAPPEDDRGPGT